MSSHSSKQPRSGGGQSHGYGGYGSSGYGYGGGGYGYGGYGYGGYGYGYGSKREGGLQRSLQDYVLILRERIWYIIVVFLVVFSSALVYTLSQSRIYQGTVKMKVTRHTPSVLQNPGTQPMDIWGPEEMNTILAVFESQAVLDKVADRLTGPELHQFMAPYDTGGVAIGPKDILGDNRKVTLQRGSFIILVQYRHPDPVIAANVANYFAEAYLDYNDSINIGNTQGVAGELKQKVGEQQKLVTRLDSELNKYVVDNNLLSLKKNTDTVTDTLKTQTGLLNQYRTKLDEVSNMVVTIDDYIKEGKDLTTLPAIAAQTQIETFLKSIHDYNIGIEKLEVTYGPKWPDLVQLKKELAQTQQELKIAVDYAVAVVRENYNLAKSNLEDAEKARQQAEEESRHLNELAGPYEQMQRRLDTEESLLKDMTSKLAVMEQGNNLDINPTSIVDRALTPPPEAYVAPNLTVNLGLGVAAGLSLGLVFAFFVAYIDDRVKSSFDIESVVGLPLIGIIPQIKKMEQPDKAQIVANNADRQVSEAFLALHSALRLKDESKNGQCILITSTIPGEGKSFVTSNLALTFAAHGERVLIIDCDLRKPNVHKSFRQENLKGLIDVIAGGASIDDVMIKQLHPNLDIITSGGRAKNPTQILNSKKFEIMISDLRKRYDRIFFDTPPLAAVSDALIILPLVDGSIFSIFFNKVRRKAAQFAAKKLLEANISVYGAVLNGLNLTVSGYYYAQYYDKSYKDYYVVMSKGENQPPS